MTTQLKEKEAPAAKALQADCIEVSLLTGGSDRPYVFGLTRALIAKNVSLDLIGSDELEFPEFLEDSRINFLKFRGSQHPGASIASKISRILTYYLKLIRYTVVAKPRIFHILWNNKFEHFDRTILMLYYKLFGKKVVFTAHNVNAARRDSRDSRLNRLTLRMQYRIADCIFVHTEKMKQELVEEFGVSSGEVEVIPFGINNAVPNTHLTSEDARRRLGLDSGHKVLLFFGRITPYKGIEYLVDAFRRVSGHGTKCRVIIAGRVDRAEEYWSEIKRGIAEEVRKGEIIVRDSFIPDEETELYFKAADALVLPYKNIYQSGVLFLAHSFGLPVLAADVGSLSDDIVAGRTGYSFEPENPADLARAIEQFFASDLYSNLLQERPKIQEFARKRHSWDVVSEMTVRRYAELLRARPAQ